MNFTDSVKHILKNKSQSFLSELWRDDLKEILADVGREFEQLLNSGSKSIMAFRKNGYQIEFKNVAGSSSDLFFVLRTFPRRVSKGIGFFKQDLVAEIDNLPDQKQKTIFCLKVIGALSSFTLGTVYNVRMGKADFSVIGLRRPNAFTQFLVAELLFRIIQRLIQKFLVELEKEVSDPEDLKHIRYFRELVDNRSPEGDPDQTLDPEFSDPAIELVEKLKNYILSGRPYNIKVHHDREPN